VDVPEIDVDELEQRLDEGCPLIDVREPDEYEAARVPGGQLIPLATVPERLAEVPVDRTVYVICAKGGRSRAACEFYRQQGIDAVNVFGGTEAWVVGGFPHDSGPSGVAR